MRSSAVLKCNLHGSAQCSALALTYDAPRNVQWPTCSRGRTLMRAGLLQDANVVRVLARLRAVSGDPASREAAARWAALAGALVDPQRPGDFNQACHGQPAATHLRPALLLMTTPWGIALAA